MKIGYLMPFLIVMMLLSIDMDEVMEPNPNKVTELRITEVNLTNDEVDKDMEPLYVYSALVASGEVVIIDKETSDNMRVGSTVKADNTADPVSKVALDTLYEYTDDPVLIDTVKQRVRNVADDLVAKRISFD